MIAQGPNPAQATPRAHTAATSVAAISLISIARYLRSRINSDICVTENPETNKPTESTMNSRCTSCCPKISATSPDTAIPTTIATTNPITLVAGKTPSSRSASEIVLRCTNAGPSAGSVNIDANDTHTIAIPATPYCPGVSSRANTSATTTREPSDTT